MKKLLIISTLLFSSLIFAQVESFEDDYIELIKKDVQAESRAIVEQNLDLTEEQAKIFWPIYDEYDAAFDKIVDERVAIIEEYMLNYYALDEQTGKDIINKAMDLNQKILDTKKKYITKMMADLPVSVVGKFFQLDNRITALVDIVRMSTVPLVREEEN